MRWTVPNILTILRLIAAPFVAIMFLYFTRPWADFFALALFVAASLTDWIDGRLARAWGQETKLGTMLDPIADKVMVMIALLVLVAFSSIGSWIILPATLILFREVFVSGLREYLGDNAHLLKVTRFAKYKTTVQMVALSVLFAHGIFEHYLIVSTWGMDEALVNAMISGEVEDTQSLGFKLAGMAWTETIGFWLIWVAALMTLLTGWDYLRKALPLLREAE